jgi:hypothetical protein
MDPVTVIGAISTVLTIVDQVSNQLKRFREKQPEPEQEPTHRITTHRERPDTIIVREEGREVERITAGDIAKLDENSRKLIKALEDSMQQQYDLWVEVYPKRDQSADPVVNARVNRQLKEIAMKMCADLERIFQYLDSIGKYLDDHYGHVRFVCEDIKGT